LVSRWSSSRPCHLRCPPHRFRNPNTLKNPLARTAGFHGAVKTNFERTYRPGSFS
jgi:hypothetical protein